MQRVWSRRTGAVGLPLTIDRVKRSLRSPSLKPEQNQQPVDGLLRTAGLVRSRRKSPSGVSMRLRALREEARTKQELTVLAPTPTRSGNGVGLLQIPAWRDRKAISKWLWHGFSTRLGGTSRAYCGEDAPGELNLGFTADDDRDAVAQNRRLLTEAVTGDDCTPVVALRQFHSNLVIVASAADADRERPRKADGAITGEPGWLIAIQTADCIHVAAARCRGFSCGLAGNSEADCGTGRGADASRIRFRAGRPDCRDRTGRGTVLLRCRTRGGL
jgi:hypothetical protein